MSFVMIVNVNGKQQCHKWQTSKPKPKFDVKSTETIVLLLQASGPSLDFVKRFMSCVPTSKHITTWRGDMAQFVYDNL